MAGGYWDYETVLSRMLIAAQEAQPEVDTREGSLIYTAVAPMAAELAQSYIAAMLLLENTFADTANREYLIRRAAERGVYPYPAVAARYTCAWEYNNDDAPKEGEEFYTSDGVSFIVKSVTPDGKCLIECAAPGIVGNGKTGSLVPAVPNQNFKSLRIITLTIIGEDEETTEHLRKRYFQELESLDFGGNVVDYINFTNKLDNVGAVKVFPTWNGGGTVKVVFADASLQAPSAELVDQVQEKLDPEVSQGNGIGIAPIGHTVTVVAAEADTVNVSAYFIYKPGFSFTDRETYLQEKLNRYINTLNREWESSDVIIVREATLVSEFLSVEGVLDIQELRINGVDGNYVVRDGALAAYGTITDTSTG